MRYRFEIIYCPKPMQDAVKLMKSMDLDIEGVGLKHTMQFTTSKDTSISDIKRHITSAYQTDGCQVLSIQGGMIE